MRSKSVYQKPDANAGKIGARVRPFEYRRLPQDHLPHFAERETVRFGIELFQSLRDF
jgi:hypothetical protein